MTYEIYPAWMRDYNVGGYTMHRIAFYSKEGIVVSNSTGWLSTKDPDDPGTTRNDDKIPLVLDKEPVRKLKLDFAKMYAQMQPFYAKGDFEYKGIKYYFVYTLYIPYIPEEWEVSTRYRESVTTIDEYAFYVNKKRGYVIKGYKGSVPIEDISEFVRKVTDILLLCGVTKYQFSEKEIVKNRTQITDKLRDFSFTVNNPSYNPDDLEIV